VENSNAGGKDNPFNQQIEADGAKGVKGGRRAMPVKKLSTSRFSPGNRKNQEVTAPAAAERSS
jgi:hypothetical protein